MSRSHSSPVIVTGMHCSGTTILSRILQGCGLFMGAERNQQEEAVFFEASTGVFSSWPVRTGMLRRLLPRRSVRPTGIASWDV